MDSNDYKSCFGEHIKTFIALKRQNGFVYDTEAYQLKKFDEFCAVQGETGPGISRELAVRWGTLRAGETRAYLSGRVTAVRQLCIYLNSIGIESYVPRMFTHKSGYVSHVLDDDEIKAFFQELDADAPKAKGYGSNSRIHFEMQILFRLLYCCGLRLSETTHIKLDDIDFIAGTIAIYHSKGRKDRLIYFSGDMGDLLKRYLKILECTYHVRTQLLFPAQDISKAFQNSAINQKFNKIWRRTIYAERCVQKPTVHSFRHSFVVKRMNLWMENKEDLSAMMPYLSKYLGHTSVDDTFYYYHQTAQAFKIVKEKDVLSDIIIPEVHNEAEKNE